MNRATAQTQKEMSEEEGLAPILAWVKDLIDGIIAQEFAAPDLEFTWSAEPSIDPQVQEAVLTSYAAKGLLTINEARAALGRDPFPDAAANRPMTLTGGGYVPLGQVAQAAGKTVQTAPVSTLSALDKGGDWDEDQHPRWPAGSSDHRGGEFAPKDGSGEGSSSQIAMSAECQEQWNWALDYCDQLLRLPEFHPDRRLSGGHTTLSGCAKGFVSAACGGNKV